MIDDCTNCDNLIEISLDDDQNTNRSSICLLTFVSFSMTFMYWNCFASNAFKQNLYGERSKSYVLNLQSRRLLEWQLINESGKFISHPSFIIVR